MATIADLDGRQMKAVEKERANKKHSELREGEDIAPFLSINHGPQKRPDRFQILSRLPAKSVVRFKSVCKQWLALASDPVFLAAHTRCSPLTVSGLLIQDSFRGNLFSFSVDGGASPVLPDPSLSSLDHRFGDGGPLHVLQSCNGLLLCTKPGQMLSKSHILLNPTTMQYRQIPNPPTDLYSNKYQFMLAFDPSTSLQYRIACLSSNITLPSFDPTTHVEIYSSDTSAWELSRETVPGGSISQKGVYWNGALHWITENAFVVSFDVEQQVVKTTWLPSGDRGGTLLYFGESRGHLHLIETGDGKDSSYVDWMHFQVFEMGKDNASWSLLHIVDLCQVWDVYGYMYPTPCFENALGISSDWSFRAAPVFFARGGRGEDDMVYLISPEKIVCCNLADRTCRRIFAMNSRITLRPFWSFKTIQCFPFAHSLFSP
ncbi:F-box protein At5g07610-like [Elaeis guineensis]|uniref:F-box protein At5g07610-like n=1 Tax=Elaeis guineensis var. tenera TaxID=51953 RepID=UPI003C6D2EC6